MPYCPNKASKEWLRHTSLVPKGLEYVTWNSNEGKPLNEHPLYEALLQRSNNPDTAYKLVAFSLTSNYKSKATEAGLDINDPDTVIELLKNKNTGEPLKKGVAELFESNSELANAVYEAAGFKSTFNSQEEFDKIANSNSELSNVAKILSKYGKGLSTRIVNSNLDSGGVSYTNIDNEGNVVTDVSIDLNNIKLVIANRKDKQNFYEEVVLHEEVHRYTQTLFDIKNALIDKKDWKNGLKNTGLTASEINFIEEVEDLYNQYLDNKIDNVDFNQPNSSIKEFITYGLTNPEFIKALSNIKVKNTTVLQKLIDLLSKLFGNNVTIKNALEKSFENFMANESIIKDSLVQTEYFKTQITPQQKQQAQQQYSQYLDTIFPDSKVVEMDNSLYISVLNQLEQENKIEKDCTGVGKLKAKDGITTLFEKGGKWELVTDFKNAPTHKAGGKDISIQGKKVEIEKNELRIENDFGDVAVIPSKYRVEVKDAIKSNCHSCIDNIVESLPKMKDYAGDGTVFPFFGRYKRFKNSLPGNLKNTSEDDYAMRYYWKHNNKPKSFDEAINRERPMFTMEDDGYYHAPSVEPNTLRFLKPKNHPTLQYELDWYNSDNPGAVDFKSKYDLDTSGKFYKYVPKKK